MLIRLLEAMVFMSEFLGAGLGNLLFTSSLSTNWLSTDDVREKLATFLKWQGAKLGASRLSKSLLAAQE